MKNILSLPSQNGRVAVAVLASCLSVATIAQAQTADEPIYDFGQFGQGNAGITVANTLNIQPNACVPTSVDDGLIFLENYQVGLGHTDPFSASQNNVNVINTLATGMGTENNNFTVVTNGAGKRFFYKNQYIGTAPGTVINAPGGPYYVVRTDYNVGGTSLAKMVSGLTAYLPTVNPVNLPHVYTTTGVNPSAGTLAQFLSGDDAIELTMLWGTNNAATGKFVATGGGHEVDLEGIKMTSATTGTLTIVDPWGATQPGGAPAATANLVTCNITVTNGGLFVSGNFGDDSDVIGNYIGAGGQNASAMVTYDMVESVPDSASTLLLLGVSAMGLTALRNKFGKA